MALAVSILELMVFEPLPTRMGGFFFHTGGLHSVASVQIRGWAGMQRINQSRSR